MSSSTSALPGVGAAGGRVDVTTHAELAFLQRVDPTEPYPASAIRAAWRRSEDVPGHPAARRDRELMIIYESRRRVATILTVYPATRGVRP